MIPDGRSKGHAPSEFDKRQLKVGTRHELEHTRSRRIAQRIAMDHLIEDPSYYRKLAKMEKGYCVVRKRRRRRRKSTARSVRIRRRAR